MQCDFVALQAQKVAPISPPVQQFMCNKIITTFFTHFLNMAVQRTIIALLLDEEDEEQRNRIWSRPWIIKRQQYGAFHTLFAELKLDNLAFKDYLRLDKMQFELLLQKIHKHIIKQDTNMRECIKPEEMCCLTLRYLASGESFRSLEFQFRIGKRTISNIILDVCMAIIEELRNDYFTTPNTEDAWLDISKKFFLRWNFRTE